MSETKRNNSTKQQFFHAKEGEKLFFNLNREERLRRRRKKNKR